MQQASQSAQAANVLFNVSEFDNINDATTALVAMSAAYEDAANGIEKINIVDRLNLIGNNYAIATDELATALQDSASALTTSGNSLDEAIALVTSGNRVVQNASVTGKGIRTIALRLTGTKSAAEELEEMGEDTSDMIMSQSKMRELIMNATKVASNNFQGFDIQDELGKYKSTYQIMLGLANIWEEIRQADLKTGDNRQNLLLESIAGKNRANVAASILSSPDVLQSVYEDSSTKSAGSALEENQKKLDSISGHLARLTNAWQELWANAANRDIINMFIDLGTTILNVINEVGGLQSAFTLLYGGTILKGLMTADSWLVKFIQGLDNAKASSQGLGDTLNNVFTNLTGGGDPNKETRWKGLAQIQKNREDAKTGKTKDSIADETKEVIEANKELAESEELVQAATEGSTIAKEADMATEGAQTGAKMAGAMAEEADATSTANNTDQTNKNTIATEANTAAEGAQSVAKGAGGAAEAVNSAGGIGGIIAGAVANPMTWLMAIPAVLALISTIINSIKKQQQELIDGEKEAASTWQEAKTGIDEYAQKYQELRAQLQNTNLSEEEQADIKKQIYELQKQITEEYGNAASGVSLVNGELDTQLAKLRQIKAEEARKNLLNNEKEYKNAQKEMEAERTYNMIVSRNAPVTDQAQQILDKYGYELKQRSAGMGTVEQYIEFKGDASEAEQVLQELFDEVGNFSEDERVEKGLQTFFTSISSATEKNNQILRDHQEAYNAFLEEQIFANDDVYGNAQQTAGEVLIELENAVNDYNMALQSGDTSQIEKTKKTFEDLKDVVDDITKDMGDIYSRPFDDLIDKVDSVQEEAYNVKKKFDDPKVKNVVESVLGTPKENKKSAEEIPDALRDAAENILNEQRKAYEWGMKPFGVNPLQMMYSQSQFGNIDMNNRPTIKWDDDRKKQFADALKSWNYNPEKGTIDTVFGGSDNFNGLEIAFTPILTTEDGKADFMSYDAVHEYIQGLVEKATDKDGNIDAQLVLDLDAGKVKDKDIIPKQIIGAIDGISKYSAATVGKMMHFSGTKGAIYLGMEKLSKAAKDAGLNVQKVMDILQKTGNVDALSGLFDDFKYDVTDIEGYLSNLSNLPPEIASDIQTIADAFGITADSSQESISAVAELLGSLGYIATTSLDEAGESFDKFALKASGWIEETSNLSSVLSKGQGFLTFTKTQDDQGHEIASEVKALADAYKDLPGYNYASLFEETAGGIMVNAEALRALQSQEESMRHAEFYEKRQELMEKFTASSGAAAEAYRAQIEELDMLWSAYSGATSALSKYQNNHGAADYSTNYKLFRDQIFKEGDEYLNSGETGEEGFRRIAQLFSYKDLALASVTEVEDAFIHGADTMQKFFTEDPTEGANLWIDEIMSWPEEYAKISTNAAGETVMSMTDQNLDAVAKHYGVSKDLILSLMNELNATGSRVHFFTDGQMQQLEQVNERAEAARKALIEMKDQGTDPVLANSDILNFDTMNMSAEELETKIKELQDLRANPDIDTETASLLDELLKSAIESLDLINGKHVEPQLEMNVDGLNYSKEVAEDLNERLKQISEYQELGYDITITGDEKVKEISTEIASWSEEMQKSYGFEPSINPEDIVKQIEEKFPDGIKLQAVPEIKQEDVDAISGAAPEVKVNADTLPAQTAIEHLSDDFTPIEKPVSADTSQAEEQTDSLFEKITAPIKAIFGMEVYADEVDEAREEAEKPIETDVHFKPDNSVQDAANQAGAQQGVNTTTTETKVTNEETHTVATADTAQLDVLNQKMQSVQAMGGSTVSIGVAVSGIENIEAAEGNINRLIAKDKSKVTVSINGNAAMFNKTYSQTNTALNTLAQKKTEPKITANNSSLKDKVSDSKEKLNSIKDKPVKITASQSGFTTISTWKSNVFDKLYDKEIKIKTTYTSSGTPPKGSPFQGSAHNQGTVISKGHAYASGTLSGDWGLPKAEKGALINELGSEIIVTPDGHWQILNSGDPTFVNLPKGSIIFNHKQSESLLKKGYINGSHGKMVGGAFVNGTVDDEEEFEGDAYAIGTTGWNGSMSGMAHASAGTIRKAQKRTRKNSTSSSKSSSGSKKSSGGGKSGKSSGNSSSKKAKDNLQTLDAIEIRLNRIDALISQLDTNAGKSYDTFAARNSALVNDLATVNKEIAAINSSLKSGNQATSYLAKASAAAKEAGLKKGDEGYSAKSAGASGKALSQLWIHRIQNSVNSGRYFTINDVKDDGLWKKIQAYQTWYEKYVKLQQKVKEQTNKLSQLTIQQLSLIQTKWESTISNITAQITTNQNTIDLAIEKGYNASESYYNGQILLNQQKIQKLNSEITELQKNLNNAVKTGRIKEGSEEWYKWYVQIKNIKNEVISANKDIQSLLNSIRQIRWDKFDRGQESISNVIDELEFLGGLINEIDLYDQDTGAITNKGMSALAIEAQKYDLYIKQAQQYKNAITELNKEIAKDPNNKTLIDQRNTWLKAQQEAISNAHSEKEAIADLVEKGIKLQIEAMEKLIDKYEEALDAERDQEKYAESIAEKQKKINSLQKQLNSMEGDDSEEGASRRQKLRDELKEAQKDLQETQEDQRLSDIKDALSNMQERYEEVLNTRLDNIDALLEETVRSVNQSGADICNTIKEVASSVNYSLTDVLNKIYTGVSNLSANNADKVGQTNALVSGTSTTKGTVNNSSASTLKQSPTTVTPKAVTMPKASQTTSTTTTAKTTTTTAKATTTTTAKPATTTATKTTTASKVKNGMVTENGKTYYYKNNQKQTGWKTVNGKKYYFSTINKAMLTGVHKMGTRYYLFNKSGVYQEKYSGLYQDGNNTYYFKSGNAMTGWQGKRYFAMKNAKMVKGMLNIGNYSYYFDPKTGIVKTGTFKVNGVTYVANSQGRITKKNGKTVKGALAKGTPNVVRAGMYRVDEEGNEVFINKNGKIYTRLEKGTTVLPHDAAINLLKGMSNPSEFIASHMDMRPNKNITTTNNTSGDTVNYITFKMDGVTNYSDFMREAQRDPNFTKYIQEISIGKLNGNNSLKGNSIRFR